MVNGINNSDFGSIKLVKSRIWPMLIVAGVIIGLTFIIPIPAKVLDVLWVCVFCLSMGVSIVCLSARSSSDLIGFTPMMAGLILLRFAALAGTVKHTVRDEPAGSLINWAGAALASHWQLGAVLACLFFSVIILLVVFGACQKIVLASKGYLDQILPLKLTGIETDLRLDVINEDQAKEMADRVTREANFFDGMNRMSFLMRFESVICVVALLICLIVPASNNAMSPKAGVGLLSAIAPIVVGLSIFSLVPVMAVAITSGMLMSKDTLAVRSDTSESFVPSKAKKITVVALDSEESNDTQLLNPDFMEHRVDEQVVEFESQPQLKPANLLPEPVDISCRNAKEYYEKLTQFIGTIKNRPRLVLLASDKLHSLPVTVGINVAIRLAQKKQKVLLVDTDAQRNAVGSVFDLDLESMRKKVQASSLENLSVCCVPAEKLDRFFHKKKIFDRFDTTLIYTPNIESVGIDQQPESIKLGAFYFSDEQNSDTKSDVGNKMAFCSWACLIPSIQSVLDNND